MQKAKNHQNCEDSNDVLLDEGKESTD